MHIKDKYRLDGVIQHVACGCWLSTLGRQQPVSCH